MFHKHQPNMTSSRRDHLSSENRHGFGIKGVEDIVGTDRRWKPPTFIHCLTPNLTKTSHKNELKQKRSSELSKQTGVASAMRLKRLTC